MQLSLLLKAVKIAKGQVIPLSWWLSGPLWALAVAAMFFGFPNLYCYPDEWRSVIVTTRESSLCKRSFLTYPEVQIMGVCPIIKHRKRREDTTVSDVVILYGVVSPEISNYNSRGLEFLVRLSQHVDCRWPSQWELNLELFLRNGAKRETSGDSVTQGHGTIPGSKSLQLIGKHIAATFSIGIWRLPMLGASFIWTVSETVTHQRCWWQKPLKNECSR